MMFGKDYYMNEIYNEVNFWKDILHLGGNLLASFEYSNSLTFYEIFYARKKDPSKYKLKKYTTELNIKDSLSNLRNASKMKDGSILGSINNKIIIIKNEKNDMGDYDSDAYLLNNINDEEENYIKKVIQLSNKKLLICDNSKILNICNFTLNKKENKSKRKSSHDLPDNILEKEAEIQVNNNFDINSTMIMEVTDDNEKLIMCQNFENKTLYFYELKNENYVQKFEINKVNSNYILPVCDGYLIGYPKGINLIEEGFIELISINDRKVCNTIELKNFNRNPIIDVIIDNHKYKKNKDEYCITLLRHNYLINQIYFNPIDNKFKIISTNDFIQLRNTQKEFPNKIFEFKRSDEESEYILFSPKKAYLMSINYLDSYLGTITYLLLLLLTMILEKGNAFDVILYLIIAVMILKLFIDYDISQNKKSFFKEKKNSNLVLSMTCFLIMWFFKYIPTIQFFTYGNLVIYGLFGIIFAFFLIKLIVNCFKDSFFV